MKALLEYLPLIVFFVFYKFLDIYWATGALIVLSGIQILVHFIMKKPIPKRHWIFFFLILIFGGLTIFFHDDTFLKWKVSIINGFFALALLISRYVFNNNIIKQFLQESMELPEKIWDKLNLAWAIFFIFCGSLNWYIAFHYDLETWVNFKVFGLTGLTFIFAIGSIASLYKYLPQEDTSKEEL